jgi:hypothetical protein
MEDITPVSLYRDLNFSKHEIRLVSLWSASSVGSYETIRCELLHICLEEGPNPEYEALSYQWGKPDSGLSILLGGQYVQVQKNLYWALQHLRLPTSSRILWIDALCINQKNIAERNHQVTWMGEIYMRAERVVVWLGMSRGRTINFDNLKVALQRRKKTKLPAITKRLDFTSVGATKVVFQEIQNLFNLRYWKRLWILQEVLSATKIISQLEYQQCSWDLLETIIFQLQHPQFRERIIKNGRKRPHLGDLDRILEAVPTRLCNQRNEYKRSGFSAQPLLDLVLKFHDAQCQNLQDKIFGLHSLSQACCKKDLPVDYSKPILQVCQELLRHHVLHHHSHDDGEAMRVIEKTRGLNGIFRKYFHSIRSENLFVYSNMRMASWPGLLPLTCYLRGPILYIGDAAQITEELRAHGNELAIPMPTFLNRALRSSMRSFLHDAQDFLPTTCKPNYTYRSWQKRLSVFCRKSYSDIIASVKKQSIWNDWLWALELPDHEDLWEEWPYIFFTRDGQIGLAAEELQLGDLVCEFDRKKPHSIILRRANEQWFVVGSSSKVLGAWGPTPWGSLQRITISLDVTTLQSLSERVDTSEAVDDFAALQRDLAIRASAAWD